MLKRRVRTLPPAFCQRDSSMDHRIKSGGDEVREVAWQNSGAKARHENGECYVK
jgi:hypothetical protein